MARRHRSKQGLVKRIDVEVMGPESVPAIAFPVVGIGASAGGLEAFSLLLKNLEVTTGMAFVLVQHLDPSHQSLLSEILGRTTALSVATVLDGVSLQPDHIYVMPPNTHMKLVGDRLRLTRRTLEDGRTPIDDFFISLAHAACESAVGVVLSGTGSDGAKGLAAITNAGGVTFAQEPGTAKFDGMPNAAIAAQVDFVLAPAAIAVELGRLARRLTTPGALARGDHSVSTDLDAEQLGDIFAMLRVSRGTDFAHYKPATIQRRILRRMSVNGFTQTEDYVDFLRQQPAELDRLYEDILIKVTCFFRKPESFAAMAAQVYPAILRERPPTQAVRVWVPGCASGEEAYSIAIGLIEAMEAASMAMKLEIFATDISETALAKARIGHYDESIADHVSPKRLQRFFTREGSGYRVIPSLRDCCLFAKQNVARDPPFSKLDLISCRNLMIYLTADVQRQILSTFHFALNPGGFLTLGSSETIGAEVELFTLSDKTNKVFTRSLAPHGNVMHHFSMEAFNKRLAGEAAPLAHLGEHAKKVDLKVEADQALLAKYVAAGVVINERMDVVQFRGDTSPYLLHPPGDVTVNIFKMCRTGLLAEVRTALHEAAISGRTVKKDGWITGSGVEAAPVSIDVVPFAVESSAQRYFIVLFAPRVVLQPQATDTVPGSQHGLARLELELAETKAYLNAIIEKEQATNEELKSASEEILSANEELQSSNEEMATAKEEVQAANEELITVNDELQSRNLELSRVNSDLNNLFGSVQIPIVMLAENLVIRRFTPAAEKVLNLSAKDIGQSLTAVAAKLAIERLPQLAAEVIESLNTREQEVQDRSGRWFSLRIKPYRTSDNKIEGAVIALVDIDALKRNFAELSKAYDYAEAIVQTAPVPLLVLDENLCVITVNQTFLSHFQVRREDTAKTKVYDLGNGQWNVPGLRQLLEEILPKNELMENFIVDHEFPVLGRRTMRLSARRLAQQGQEAARILLAIQDMTEQRRSEESILIAKEAAELANHAKSEFLANMSHEIRTPLGAVLGYSELLADPQQTRAEALQCATRIRKNVEHLTELIDEVLDIAKIEAGKLDVERVRFALLPELAECVASLRDRAVSKGLSFDVRFDSDLPETIMSCAKRLRQILLNIVGNAVKFTERGGVSMAVRINANGRAAASPKLSFMVMDTGAGLSALQQTRLFQPFSQADSSVTRRFGGTGLGLILARQLAEALGGDVKLTESQIGRGSTFTISIDPGTLAGVPMLPRLSGDTLEQHAAVVSDWFAGNKRLQGLRVLLAEDGPDNQVLISHFIRSSGAAIEVVANGLAAVEAAQTGLFDVVLMDIQMPLLDGYEATRRLRAAGCPTPVIALTAHSMRGEREKCLEAGCSEYLSKPVKPTLLVEVVAKVAGKKVPPVPNESAPKLSLPGDPFAELVMRFVHRLPARVEAMHRAYRLLDRAGLVTLAHQLAGAAGGYGFPELGAAAAVIEAEAQDPAGEGVLAATFIAFDALCTHVVEGNWRN